MSRANLFSTYRQGENRVTGSMMAVFERIGFRKVERLLASAMEESSLQLVSFKNQATSSGGRTIPDARISGSFAIWFEVKTAPNALTAQQLRGHLNHLGKLDARYEHLCVLTPDQDVPDAIATVGDAPVLWFNFQAVSDAIDALLGDPSEISSEKEQLLLRELQSLFEVEGLLSSRSDDVVVVPAREAYATYLQHHAYVCQPRRSFRNVNRIAFYRQKRIEPQVPEILHVVDELEFSQASATALRKEDAAYSARLATLIENLLAARSREEAQSYKVMLLSGPDDEETLNLEQPVIHDDRSAWVQKQRYVGLDALKSARTTADLSEEARDR